MYARSNKLILSKAICIAVLWVATAICSLAQTFTTLLSFDDTDGEYPQQMSLIQGSDGNLYGTTFGGGAYNACVYGCGTVFKITSDGTLTTLHNFAGGSADGFYPYASLVLATDRNFYGTTYDGAAHACGMVFKIASQGELTVLFSFYCRNGGYPEAGLVQATNGDFYGTTSEGGANSCAGLGCGTVFKITSRGKFTRLHSFDGPDGNSPYAGLVQAADGNFYGTTYLGGFHRDGTVFELTPGGTLTSLHSFVGSDGSNPTAGLVQASDGNFYGTTSLGGAYGEGTVFKITPDGSLTTLYNFCAQSGCPDGGNPIAGLMQATDGNFYGTTVGGGAYAGGTIFSITSGGTLTTLHSFAYTDGSEPTGGLVQGTNGDFYGTTTRSGANCTGDGGCGTVFSLSVGLGPFVETNPTSGKVGAKVSILGTDLTAATGVTFKGTAATFKVVSKSEIMTTVPTGATTGIVQVVTPGGTLNSNVNFRVTP